MTESCRREIFNKFDGHCHFCGDPLVFENRGWAEVMDGHWEVDHVVQRDKGGRKTADNCLPACTRCNRLRWHRTGDAMRNLLLLGVIAMKQIKDGNEMGRTLRLLRRERLRENKHRRKKRQQRYRP